MDRESVLSMDPNMLVSVVNMKLRDSFSSLLLLCDDIGISEIEIKDRLKTCGYEYNEKINQFK